MKRRNIVTAGGLVILSLAGGALRAQDYAQKTWQQPFHQEMWRPLGVYAHLDIEDLISQNTGTEDPHSYVHGVYQDLLADPPVAGITVGQHWDTIQTSNPNCVFTHSCPGSADGYDWSYLDDAFAQANAVHKSVQLIITPGVDAPAWLLAKIPPCDGLFATPAQPVAANCGTFNFLGIPEAERADHHNTIFPLPWNDVYKLAWWDFLAHLSARYSRNPAFVAMEIGGPNGASVEIILPTSANETQLQAGGLRADDIWAGLIQHAFPNVPQYQNSDQVFVDQWNQTIDVYDLLFSGVTLILSPDAGGDLPLFKDQNSAVPQPPGSDLALFNQDCSDAVSGVKDDLRSCEAKTEIIAHFLSAWDRNAKATEVGGMTASSQTTIGNIGVPGIKLLTQLSPPQHSILAGAQFDHPASDPKNGEGCTPAEGPSCTLAPEQAAYNVLQNFFDGTAAAASFGGTYGPYSVTYLDVPPQDIEYAQAPANQCPTTSLGKISFQDLLNQANHALFALAGEWIPLPPSTCP